MSGRGAWNNSGVGGTKDFRKPGSQLAVTPGPYYYLGTGYGREGVNRDANEYACWGAVKAYQEALNREGVRCLVDGLYGPATVKAMTTFQMHWLASGDPKASVWGGVGPESSERLLRPVLDLVYGQVTKPAAITAKIVGGVIRSESSWDAGAVGFVDATDVGLAQINAAAHPEWDTDMRLHPETSFRFVIAYLIDAYGKLNSNIRDTVASYNLGVGGKNSAGKLVGCKAWIAAGRPDYWTPPGGSAPRAVKKYIDLILAG